MKAFTKMAAATVAMALASQSAWAADAPATVSLVSPITVAKTFDLAFGQVAKPSSGSTTKTISLAGARSGTANDVGTQTISAATFNVTGEGELAYTPTITVTSAGVTGLLLSDMIGQCGSVGTGTSLPLTVATGLTGCSLASGASVVKVGGTLTIASTATGTNPINVGNINVTVAYN
jgi:hypothetical protein